MVDPSSLPPRGRGDIVTLLCGESPPAISNSTPLSLLALGEASGEWETVMGFLRPVIPGKEASLTRDGRALCLSLKYRMSKGIDLELLDVPEDTLVAATACIRALPSESPDPLPDPLPFLLWRAGGTAEADLTDK